MKKYLDPSRSNPEKLVESAMQTAVPNERKRPQVTRADQLRKINPYVDALLNEFSEFAFDEVPAQKWRGVWRQQVFSMGQSSKLNVEIGTGNGLHLARKCLEQVERLPSAPSSELGSAPTEEAFVGLELKFKPLIQTVRRCLGTGFRSMRGIRAHAFNLDLIFAPEEINDLYIHFPDPWVSPRKPEKRLTTRDQLNCYFDLQKPGSILEFKTDSQELFDFSQEEIPFTRYRVEKISRDIHGSEKIPPHHLTQFERLFIRQGLPIYYCLMIRP